MPSLGLFKRREIWFPTWRGAILLLGLATALSLAAISTAVPFLAASHPLYQGVLVVEGWLPDYALEEAKQVFENHSYRLLIVTGVPIDKGFHISQEKNYAQLAASTLKHFGLKDDLIVPVACPQVPRDRTYSTARQVGVWLETKFPNETVDVLTLGVHARRTWLLYTLALGEKHSVGVIAARDDRYDPKKWWTTSSGFRTVTSEMFAYVYAKLLFRPPKQLPATGS